MFVHDALPMRVVFGPGALDRVAEEVDLLGLHRVLVLSTPRQGALAARVTALLGERAAGTFDGARMHVPSATVAAAEDVAASVRADGCLAIGGGSTIGLAKALSLRQGLPSVVVPTTYAGSEMTPVWGLTEDGRKTTGRDPVVLPRSVVYDPDLTHALPAAVSGPSGLNAIAHAVEALYAPNATPVISAMAERGVRDLAAALPLVVADGSDGAARSLALEGAWLCGACLGATTMGLHHKLCHVLGGMLDLPHAETHAIVLPHVAAFNLPAAPEADAVLRRALGTDDVPAALRDLATTLGVPDGLRALGVAHADLARVADEVLAAPYSNPVAATRADIEAIVEAAWRSR
ncbi:maleylacetate reductase [Nocardioides daeguensis]|uniref:Maleylacetate reductase n=1 Tax=Nocardioides daeguensis TaxID=908359 RepID=A0ABP6VJY7_9ACTN|nr:maleylacetate reductase [Nocardioides daeguensis]MBV6727370.1 maleylacetate reductase [Nocardioides daeguensis]MCR1775459.1 maleylacetate reductase [Nocardioides daeguensis]